MKRLFGIFLAAILSILCACGSTVPAQIMKIDREETYPDVPGELTIIFRSLDQIADEADVIVQATGIGKREDLPGGLPQTHTEVRVDACLKGTAEPGSTLEIIEEGGHNGKVLGGIPQIREGTTYFLFLYDEGGGKHYICGAFQGRFIVREGYVFQQATEEVKLKNYTPLTVEAFRKRLR